MPNIQLQFRRGTSTEWSNANTVLADGELAIETNTRNFKIGNGSTNWNTLDYGGLQGYTGPTGLFVNVPDGTKVLCYYVDQITGTTTNSLTLITSYNYVYTSRPTYVTFSSPSTFVVQKNGAYEFEFQGWTCGAGSGMMRIVVTRSSTIVYDRRKEMAHSDCGIFTGVFYWESFQVGDTVQMYKNENSGGAAVTSIIDSNPDQRGSLKIHYNGPNYDTGANIIAPTGHTGFQGTQGTQGPQGPQGTQGTQGTEGVGTQGTQGPQGPAGSGGGGGSVSITGSTAFGNILTVATGGAGIFGNSNFVVAGPTGFVGIGTTSPATQLEVNGGFTIRNGYRPLYTVVSATSLTVAANSYGTHYNITNSAFATMTLPTIVWAQDSNGYWVFRNNTSSYLSVTITYTTAGTTAPVNPVVIPPSNSTTIMVTFPGGSTSNYVLF